MPCKTAEIEVEISHSTNLLLVKPDLLLLSDPKEEHKKITLPAVFTGTEVDSAHNTAEQNISR